MISTSSAGPWLERIPRRAVLLGAAALAWGVRSAAAEDGSALAADIVKLVTDPDLTGADPDSMLRRLAFRGGKPVRSDKANGVVYDIVEGGLTHAHVVLSKAATGWRLDRLTLLFGPDAPPLKALDDPLTAKFGKPRDATTGNAVWVWQAEDRIIRVTADVPGEPDPKVYVVMVAPRR